MRDRPVFEDLLLVGLVSAAGEDTALDSGVKGLDAPPEHRGILSQSSTATQGYPSPSMKVLVPPRGDELYALLVQEL